MPTASFEDLAPYLNPEYWGGHSIGHGETEDMPNPPLAGTRVAKKMLEERLGRMATIIPLETYRDGDTFGLDPYEPGTLVIMREESLHAKGNYQAVDVDKLPIELIPPPRPMDTSPSFGSESTTTTILHKGFRYYTAAKWGIVASSKKGSEKALHTVSTGLTHKYGDEVFIALPAALRHETPIEIGKTSHYKVMVRNGSERLQRVNILEVLAYGTPEYEEKPGLAKAAASLKTKLGLT